MATGTLDGGVLLEDMVSVLQAAVAYNPQQLIVPIYYGEDYNYHALAFNGKRGPTVLLNPTVHASSGLATVSQQPRFCSMARDYTLPTKVVLAGNYHNSTVVTKAEFEGARAALAFTMVQQLQGHDVCDPQWKRVEP
jgi:hypothetical protein